MQRAAHPLDYSAIEPPANDRPLIGNPLNERALPPAIVMTQNTS
jgi:hypothetical protein